MSDQPTTGQIMDALLTLQEAVAVGFAQTVKRDEFIQFRDRLEWRVTNLETRVDEGFARVDERFHQVERRLGKLESRRR